MPDEQRLDYATELFDIVDVDGQGSLNSKKLQARALLVRSMLQRSRALPRAWARNSWRFGL